PLPQSLSHAEFARSNVVIPAVVQKVDAVVDGRAHDADGLLLVRLSSEMVAAHDDQRHHFYSPHKATVGNPVADVVRLFPRLSQGHARELLRGSLVVQRTTRGERATVGAALLPLGDAIRDRSAQRSEEHTSELQSRENLVC